MNDNTLIDRIHYNATYNFIVDIPEQNIDSLIAQNKHNHHQMEIGRKHIYVDFRNFKLDLNRPDPDLSQVIHFLLEALHFLYHKGYHSLLEWQHMIEVSKAQRLSYFIHLYHIESLEERDFDGVQLKEQVQQYLNTIMLYSTNSNVVKMIEYTSNTYVSPECSCYGKLTLIPNHNYFVFQPSKQRILQKNNR